VQRYSYSINAREGRRGSDIDIAISRRKEHIPRVAQKSGEITMNGQPGTMTLEIVTTAEPEADGQKGFF
jgi:hypothetical protein